MLTLPLTLVIRLEVTIEHAANTCLVLVSIDLGNGITQSTNSMLEAQVGRGTHIPDIAQLKQAALCAFESVANSTSSVRAYKTIYIFYLFGGWLAL